MTRFPPGPKSKYPGSGFVQFRKDPMGFLERLAREFGDVVHWRIAGQHTFLINRPDLIRDVLVTDARKFCKEMKASRTLLGEGLTVSDGELHRRQRRAIQPTFRHERIPVFAEVMVRYAERARTRWRDPTGVAGRMPERDESDERDHPRRGPHDQIAGAERDGWRNALAATTHHHPVQHDDGRDRPSVHSALGRSSQRTMCRSSTKIA